jgi:hypothetical protein
MTWKPVGIITDGNCTAPLGFADGSRVFLVTPPPEAPLPNAELELLKNNFPNVTPGSGIDGHTIRADGRTDFQKLQDKYGTTVIRLISATPPLKFELPMIPSTGHPLDIT